MSDTGIYRLGARPALLGEVRNAWLGAMYVWNDVAIRHLGLHGFGMDPAQHKRIWNAHHHVKMPGHEIIVLLSTMDYAIARAKDRRQVVAALARYGQQHPRSNLGTQARIIREASLEDGDFIAWLGTSAGNYWFLSRSENEDPPRFYDPRQETKHFDIVAEALAYSKEESAT